MNNELHKSFDRSNPFPFRRYMHDIENAVYVDHLRKAILNGATEQDLLKSMRKAQLMQPAPSGQSEAPEAPQLYFSRQGQAERQFDPQQGIVPGSLSTPDSDSTTVGVDGGDVRIKNNDIRQMLGRQSVENLSDADRQKLLDAMKNAPQANGSPNPAPSQDLSASMPKNPMQKSGPFPFRDYRTDAGSVAKSKVEEDDPDSHLTWQAMHGQGYADKDTGAKTVDAHDKRKNGNRSQRRYDSSKQIAGERAMREARKDNLVASMAASTMNKAGPFPFRSYRTDAGNGDELMKSRAIKHSLLRDNNHR